MLNFDEIMSAFREHFQKMKTLRVRREIGLRQCSTRVSRTVDVTSGCKNAGFYGMICYAFRSITLAPGRANCLRFLEASGKGRYFFEYLLSLDC